MAQAPQRTLEVGTPPETSPPVAPGTVIDGRYRVLGLLGEGGMGRVYEAELLAIGRRLALKLVRREAGMGEGAARVVQEAILAGKVPHATVVPVYDCAALPDGQIYVAMELLRGESLEQAIARPVSAASVVRWLAEVARGLGAAHREGIVHRDVKPANLFLGLGAEGQIQPRILDFGIAKLLPGAMGADELVQTRAGALLGTPHYMAPERVRGEPGGPRSDLYSLGVIFYEALTGRLPFVGGSYAAIVAGHLRDPPLDPRQAAPARALPDALAALVLRLLAKAPEERPASGEALAAELEALLVAEPGLAELWIGADAAPASAEAGTVQLGDVLADRSGAGTVKLGDGLADRSGAGTVRLEDGPAYRSGAGTVRLGDGPADTSGAATVRLEDGLTDRPGAEGAAGVKVAAGSRRGRVWAAAAVAVVAAALGGGAAFTWRGAQEPRTRAEESNVRVAEPSHAEAELAAAEAGPHAPAASPEVEPAPAAAASPPGEASAERPTRPPGGGASKRGDSAKKSGRKGGMPEADKRPSGPKIKTDVYE